MYLQIWIRTQQYDCWVAYRWLLAGEPYPDPMVAGMRGIQGYPRGQFGVHFGVFDTIPIRARAYNDCVKVPVLLKTRSTGPLGCPF